MTDRAGDGKTISRELAVWAVVLLLPLAALGLVLAEPALDLRWEHHPSHFWLVLSVAAVNGARLGRRRGRSASRIRRRRVPEPLVPTREELPCTTRP